MGSSIDTDAATYHKKDTDVADDDMVKCDRFSMRGFVAEICERDLRTNWQFLGEIFGLVEPQKYSLPERWWGCPSYMKDIHADGIKGNAVEENENVNGEGSQKNDQRATPIRRIRKLTIPKRLSNKRSKEN